MPVTTAKRVSTSEIDLSAARLSILNSLGDGQDLDQIKRTISREYGLKKKQVASMAAWFKIWAYDALRSEGLGVTPEKGKADDQSQIGQENTRKAVRAIVTMANAGKRGLVEREKEARTELAELVWPWLGGTSREGALAAADRIGKHFLSSVFESQANKPAGVERPAHEKTPFASVALPDREMAGLRADAARLYLGALKDALQVVQPGPYGISIDRSKKEFLDNLLPQLVDSLGVYFQIATVGSKHDLSPARDLLAANLKETGMTSAAQLKRRLKSAGLKAKDVRALRETGLIVSLPDERGRIRHGLDPFFEYSLQAKEGVTLIPVSLEPFEAMKSHLDSLAKKSS